MIVVANEVSGSISLFNVNVGRRTPSYLHNSATEPTEESHSVEEETPVNEVASTFYVYPNPIQGGLLRLSNEMDVSIQDMQGNPVLVSKGAKNVDVSHLKAGFYILKDGRGNAIRVYIK